MVSPTLAPEKLSPTFPQLSLWKTATWEDYLTYRDTQDDQKIKLYYYQNQLLIQMGSEGINHASIGDLFTMLLFVWFSQHPEITLNTFGGCLLEKPGKRALAPDLVVYLGENYPKWQPGETRYLNLEQWGVPNLVGEISDTTIAIDLDEKKHFYADLGIPEYWVIDVQGKRVFAFQLQEDGNYQESEHSSVLTGLPIALLVQTLERLEQESNSSAANWFAKQISSLKSS